MGGRGGGSHLTIRSRGWGGAHQGRKTARSRSQQKKTWGEGAKLGAGGCAPASGRRHRKLGKGTGAAGRVYKSLMQNSACGGRSDRERWRVHRVQGKFARREGPEGGGMGQEKPRGWVEQINSSARTGEYRWEGKCGSQARDTQRWGGKTGWRLGKSGCCKIPGGSSHTKNIIYKGQSSALLVWGCACVCDGRAGRDGRAARCGGAGGVCTLSGAAVCRHA